jgi:DNA repair exonuclease SbcCD ATPase subunit
MELSEKIEQEIEEHNKLAEQIANAQKELDQRKGRISVLQEQLEEEQVQSADEGAAPPQE